MTKLGHITVYCENIDCKEPISVSFTPSDFDAWIGDCEFNCQSCGTELSVEGAKLECHICGAEIEFDHLSQIPMLFDERCPHCAGHPTWDADFLSIVVAGSWAADYAVYDWTANGKRVDILERKGRSDYWEGLVHFCSAKEFIEIYRQRRIEAHATGAFRRRKGSAGKTRAVCLTETTEGNWAEIKAAHGDYGFVFQKRDIIGIGGAPAIYLPQRLFAALGRANQEIPCLLWPYLNKLKIGNAARGKRYDFLHEREWRVPKDIDFDEIRPYAVTFPKRRPRIDDEELVLEAAREFQELSKYGVTTEDDDTENGKDSLEF